jgi:hypothetical protein
MTSRFSSTSATDGTCADPFPVMARMAEEIRLCREAGYYDLADDARDWLRGRGLTVEYTKNKQVRIY